jgi:RimJ/RimL family protein N-acetyltransferase
MIFPFIQLDVCRVLPFGSEHLTERYVSWLNDPEVVRFSEQRHRTHSIDGCRRYFESFIGSSNYFLAIEATDNNLGHIGNISVTIDPFNGVADVAILLGEKRAWGHGYATKTWNAVLSLFLTNKRIRKVTAGTMSVNKPMLRLMERSAMQMECSRARHFIWNGEEVDLILAAKFSVVSENCDATQNHAP